MMLFRYNKYRSPLGLLNYTISHEIGTDSRVHARVENIAPETRNALTLVT